MLPHRRCVHLLVVWAALQTPLLPQKFYPDDPLWKMPPPVHTEKAAERELSPYYDFLKNSFQTPGELQPKDGPEIPSQAVNTLGEVPDNPWYTNRIGTQPMTPAELATGPRRGNEPSADHKWTVIAAKTEGVMPGFTILDSKNDIYFIKFDPKGLPKMATGAEMIGSSIFWAAGYNVPENYLIEFRAEDLAVGESAKITDAGGKKRPMELADIVAALDRTARNDDGSYRALASFGIKGEILDGFRLFGTRNDDPNDIVPHEHRRDLRGLFVFSAWLGHNDLRAINTLDTLVEENGTKYIKHFLIDFASIFGSSGLTQNAAREGHSWAVNTGKGVKRMASFGLYGEDWERRRLKKHDVLGPFDHKGYHPDKWYPNYPVTAFRNRLPGDTYWAAKKVMAFTDEHLRAVIEVGEYGDREAEEWLFEVLSERRDIIGLEYFARVLALEQFRVEDGKLAFEDWGAKWGFEAAGDVQVIWSQFDNGAETHKDLGATGAALPDAAADMGDGGYLAAKLVGADEAKTVTVYLRKQAGWQVVGIDRTW